MTDTIANHMPCLWKCTALVILAWNVAWAQSAVPQNDAQTTSQSGDVSSSDPVAPSRPTVADSKILEVIHEQKAIYPDDAERAGIQGEVMVRVQVSETGNVEKVEVLSGDPILAESAIKAAKKFKFKPFIRGGKPVKVATKLPFDFYFRDKVMATSIPKDKDKAEAPGSTAQEASIGDHVPNRIKIGAGVTNGFLIRKIQPVYPREAKQNHIQGTVVLRAIIGKDGRIKDLTPISGPKELIPASVGAVQQWVYRPYMLLGEPVEVDTQITVNFQLSY